MNLSPAGESANGPQVDVAADGAHSAVFVWSRFDGTNWRIQSRPENAATAGHGHVQTLSPAGQDAYDPQVGVDADGDVVVTWARNDGTNIRIQARARSAASALFGPTQTLSAGGGDALDPQVAVDAAGDAVFTWTRSTAANWRIQTRARSAAGVLSTTQTLSPAGQDAGDPQVAVDAEGDAVFTWYLAGRIQARARSAAGVLSPVQTLSPAGQDAGDAQVAVDAEGDAVFTWYLAGRIQARVRSAAGVLGPVVTLSPGPSQEPQVAVDAAGDAVFTWTRSTAANWRIQTRARSSAGVLSNAQNLSTAGRRALEPQVAVDADGDAVFTWESLDGTKWRIEARARSVGGVLSAVTTLSAAGQHAVTPQVAVDADGEAAVTWKRFDGADDRIQAAFGP